MPGPAITLKRLETHMRHPQMSDLKPYTLNPDPYVQGLRVLDTACKSFLEDPDKPLLIWESADKCALPAPAFACRIRGCLHPGAGRIERTSMSCISRPWSADCVQLDG